VTGAVTATAPPHFLTHFGIAWEQDAHGMAGRAEFDAQLCLPGTTTPRTAALAVVTDNAAGYVGIHALGAMAYTVDLSMHVFRTPTGRAVEYVCRPLRAGRRIAVLETWCTVAGETDPFGVSVATYMVAGEPPADGPDPVIFTMPTGDDAPFAPSSVIDEPLDARLRITQVAPGVLELPHEPHLSNGRGTVQGGILSLLVERACESALADGHVDGPADAHVVAGLDVRYLSAVRVGPARAEASALRDGEGGGHLWCTVVDAGDDDRLVAHALVNTRRAA
jgi:acyl-coenzyme A thioesterase PaaI-like protein